MADKAKPMAPIAFTVGADPGKGLVILAFSTAVNRIEIDSDTATNLGHALIDRAKVATGEKAPGSGLLDLNAPSDIDPKYEMPEG